MVIAHCCHHLKENFTKELAVVLRHSSGRPHAQGLNLHGIQFLQRSKA
jgi:hypothetical protein